MADLPIIMSAPMVQATIRGRKTMTRRLASAGAPYASPWRQVAAGDRLWVRENWRVTVNCDRVKPRDLKPRKMTVMFEAGGSIANQGFKGDWRPDNSWPNAERGMPSWAGRLRPSIHMPRWASRLTLIVSSVKVERLQSISAEDAEAEGVEFETADPPFWYVPGIMPHSLTAVGVEERGNDPRPLAVRSFAKLWAYLHGPQAWAENPEVVAISFRAIRANIDSGEARQ